MPGAVYETGIPRDLLASARVCLDEGVIIGFVLGCVEAKAVGLVE